MKAKYILDTIYFVRQKYKDIKIFWISSDNFDILLKHFNMKTPKHIISFDLNNTECFARKDDTISNYNIIYIEAAITIFYKEHTELILSEDERIIKDII